MNGRAEPASRRLRWRSGRAAVVAVMLLLTACESKGDGGVVQPHVGDKPIKPIQAPATVLGQVTLAGFTLENRRRGEVKPGVEAGIVAKAVASPPRKDWRKLNLYVSFADADGGKLTIPARAVVTGDTLYVPAKLPKDASGPAVTATIRVRAGALDQQAELKL